MGFFSCAYFLSKQMSPCCSYSWSNPDSSSGGCQTCHCWLLPCDVCATRFPILEEQAKKKKIKPSLCQQLTNQCRSDNPSKRQLTKSKSTFISENSSVFVNLQSLGSHWDFGSPWTEWRTGLRQRRCFHWMASHRQRRHLIPRLSPRPKENTNKSIQPRTYFRGSLHRLDSFLS